jgi:hypothetical protein
MIPPVSPHHPGVPTAAARQGFPQEWAICHLQELATASEGGTDGRYQHGRCDLAAVAAAGQDQAGDGAVEDGPTDGVGAGDERVVRPAGALVNGAVGRQANGAEHQSSTTSTTAILAADWSTMALLAEKVATRAWRARLLTAPGQATCGLVDDDEGVVGEEVVLPAGQDEVVTEIIGGLGQVHAVEVDAHDDALVDGCEGPLVR